MEIDPVTGVYKKNVWIGVPPEKKTDYELRRDKIMQPEWITLIQMSFAGLLTAVIFVLGFALLACVFLPLIVIGGVGVGVALGGLGPVAYSGLSGLFLLLVVIAICSK
jgi:hypothetical protein